MKNLFLLRHAKSSWDDAGAADFDRVLNERGRKAAPIVGTYLREQGIKFDLIVCSPAMRTRQTIELVRAASGIDCELLFDERIYAASVNRLLEVVAEIDEHVKTVLLVGHNPGMQELIEALTGEARHVPTAALVGIELDVAAWSEAQQGVSTPRGRLKSFLTPKELQSQRRGKTGD